MLHIRQIDRTKFFIRINEKKFPDMTISEQIAFATTFGQAFLQRMQPQ